MSLMWTKNNHAWRLPDSAGGGEREKKVRDVNGSTDPQDVGEPKFEIDFGDELVFDEQSVQSSSSKPALGSKEPQVFSVVPTQSEARLGETEGVFELPELEVGNPGQFTSEQFDYGVNLVADPLIPDASTSSSFAESASAPDSPAAQNPPDFEALVMVDEPLPESISGGNAAVQDMFVNEVLKGAQQSFTASPSSDTDDTKLISVTHQSETIVFAASQEDEKTKVLEETVIDSGVDGVQDDAHLQGNGARTGADTLVATTVEGFVLETRVFQPDSPRVAELLKKDSTTAAQHETYQSPSNELHMPLGAAAKNETLSKGETLATVQNDKSTKLLKDGEAESKTLGARTKTDTLVRPLPGRAAAKGISTSRNTPPKRSNEFRNSLVFLVVALALAATLVVSKQSVNLQAIIAPSSLDYTSPTPAEIVPSPTRARKNAKSAGPLKGTTAKAGSEKIAATSKDPNIAEDSESKEEVDLEKTIDSRSEMDFVLARPTSRYALDDVKLAPLFDASVALDRVQPRRVQSFLKQLSKDYAANDSIEKNALREITARYYLQVGALNKAALLFSQACPDPGKSSDVEICLHSARGMLLSGSNQEFEEMLKLLKPRLTGTLSHWFEWLKLLDAAGQLSKPTLESFTRFSDEFVDKGPFLTSEWSLQLSWYFSKILLSVPYKLRIEYLKSINGYRRKTLEARLISWNSGGDQTTHMFPSLLSLLMRYYELPSLDMEGDEFDFESDVGLISWVFNVIAQANKNEPRQTRARLSPLFGEKKFSPLARIIEGHLAAQAGDYQGAATMISEQIGIVIDNIDTKADELSKDAQGKRFLLATQRLKEFPFLYVEWLFLGVKVAAGLNDRVLMKTVVLALEDARGRFPELRDEIQYWILLGRGYRLMGYVAGVEAASLLTEKLASTPHELGFVVVDRIWVMMQKRKVSEAKALMRKSLREIPNHARLLELGAEFAAQWSEDPSMYLRMEQEIPKHHENRGRDSTLLSHFTLRKLLDNY